MTTSNWLTNELISAWFVRENEAFFVIHIVKLAYFILIQCDKSSVCYSISLPRQTISSSTKNYAPFCTQLPLAIQFWTVRVKIEKFCHGKWSATGVFTSPCCQIQPLKHFGIVQSSNCFHLTHRFELLVKKLAYSITFLTRCQRSGILRFQVRHKIRPISLF